MHEGHLRGSEGTLTSRGASDWLRGCMPTQGGGDAKRARATAEQGTGIEAGSSHGDGAYDGVSGSGADADIAAILGTVVRRPAGHGSGDPRLSEVQAAEDQDIRELLLFEYGGSKAMKRSRLPGGWSLHADDLQEVAARRHDDSTPQGEEI